MPFSDKESLLCLSVFRVVLPNLQNGQMEYQGVIRHKDPRMCAIAANGIYHMALYSILGFDFPNLLGNDNSW